MELIKRIGYELIVIVALLLVFYMARMFDAQFLDITNTENLDKFDAHEVHQTAIMPIITETPEQTTEPSTFKETDYEQLQYSKPLMIGSIDINKASMEEIATLKGIGPVIAQRIVDYRDANGCFSSEQELLKVKGIGPKTLNKILQGKLDNSQ